MKPPYLPILLLALSFVISAQAASAAPGAPGEEDWGAYSIVPVSAQAMVLEAVDAGAAEGTVVSINKPAGKPHQKWTVAPKGDGLFAIRPAHDPSLALSAAEGGTRAGTAIVLEKDGGKPSQLWAMTKQENGAYSLTPKNAPGMGLDLLGGKQNPGAKVDLWTSKPGDAHLQWFIRPLAGSGVAGAKADDAPAYTPPAIDPKDVKEGTIKRLQFSQSKVFPGTVRDVTVFIPAQYDTDKAAEGKAADGNAGAGKAAGKPACVYVKTDGYNPGEKALLEAAIAAGEMPVTVGVFVSPGTLPAPMKGTAGRRNRCFEYDAVNDNNARFFDEELLPFVARECGLNLSTDGNDRCVSGGSSGGIAAFTAAWNRPEAFSRVYAASGSWVAFRGGNEFPTMVRKFEARPIRAFLTTATHDMENAAGDWFLLDQEMDKALKFSGYDYQFRVVEGHHVQGYAEHWREAMAFLWKDWPQRLKAGPSAPRAQEILVPGEDWNLLAEGFKSTRGPACNAAGEVFFADTADNKIHRIGLDDRVSVFVEDAGQAHCVTSGPDGALFTISEKSGNLMRYDGEGKGSVVMDGIVGHSILARPDGGFFVTTNGGNGGNGASGADANSSGSVWLVKDGQKKQLDAGIKFATGMACRPDQWLLSVAEGHSKWVYSYQVNSDGTLTNKERFFPLHVADWDDDAGAECVCYSLEGRQFVATRSGIQVTADDGPVQVILTVPGRARVTGVALGGKDKDTLYAFCGNKIWKRKVQQHAAGPWSPWTKVTPNKL